MLIRAAGEEEEEGFEAWGGAASSYLCPLSPGPGVPVWGAPVCTRVRLRRVGLGPEERILLCPFQATGSPWAGQAPAKA